MYEYIGIVTKIQSRQAYIRPLYKIQNGKTIQALKLGDLSNVFFDGLVVWNSAPAYVYQGSIWLFDVNGVGKSKYITDIKSLVEVIDVSTHANGKPYSIFKDVHSFSLSYIPSQRAYLFLGNAIWAGPISLLRYNGPASANIWSYDLNSLEEYVPLFHLAQNLFITLKEASLRHFISPWYIPEKPVGYVRVADGTIVSSKQAAQTRLLPNSDQKSQVHSVNVTVIDKQTQLKRQELEQIELNIRSKEIQKQELTAWELALLEEEITRKEQIIKQEFSLLEQKLAQKKETISKELADLDRILAMQKTENRYQIDKMNQSLESETKAYQQRLQKLQEGRVHQITASQNMETVRNAFQKPSSWSWTHSSKGKISILSEPGMIKRRLQELGAQYEKSSSVFLSVHSTLLAGGIPVLLGESALDILETYASCVTGGRVLWLPIAATMLESTDLIGKPDTATRKFIPHAAGLADLLLEAKRQPDNLYLVVLDGINRAAIEHYLQPVLNLYHELWHAGRTHPFPLFHSRAVIENDPYAELAQMHLTQNILIAATLSDGMAVIPPPASFWSKAAFIDADIARSEFGAKDTLALPLAEYSAIPAANWLIMHNHLKKRAMTISLEDINMSIFVGNNEGSLFRKILYHVLSEYLEDKKAAADMVTVQAMVPRAVAIDREGELIHILMNGSQNQQQLIKKIKLYVR